MGDEPQARVDFARRNGLAVCSWHNDGTLAHIEFAPEIGEPAAPPTPEELRKRAEAMRERRMQVLRGAAPQLRPGKPLP